MSYLHLHFDGDITKNHTVSLRTLGVSLTHLQAAVNRAHLDIKYGEVWKNARLKTEDYDLTELWSRPPKEGGYIIDFINDSPNIKKTLTRIINAVTPAVEKSKSQALTTAGTLAQQSVLKSQQVSLGIFKPQSFESYMPTASQNPYGDRAINKEIDLLISVVRAPNSGNSTIELGIGGDQSSTFKFNRTQSENFHSLVSKRVLGDPLLYSVKVMELDSTNRSSRVFNIATERQIKLHFADEANFNLIKPYLGITAPMVFIGSPIYEGGAYDAKGGDVFFIGIA